MREYTEAGRTRPGAVQQQTRAFPRPRATGPRPVRPAVVPVAVRPVQPGRPAGGVGVTGCAGGPRLPARTAVSYPAAGARLRRVLAGLLVVLVVAAIVVGLGLLADAVAQARAGGPARPQTVTGQLSAPVSPPLGGHGR